MRVILLSVLLLLASASRCERSQPPPLPPPPRVGDFVKLRGTLGEDVDCRLFRTEDARVYSLSSRLRGYANGAKLCVHGTIVENTSCLTTPMIEVQTVRPWESCP